MLKTHSWEKHLYFSGDLNVKGGILDSTFMWKGSSLFWTNTNAILTKRNQTLCPIHLPYSLTELWGRMPRATTSETCFALDTSLQCWLWSFCKGQGAMTESSACGTLGKAPERRRIILCTVAMAFWQLCVCVFRLQNCLTDAAFTYA